MPSVNAVRRAVLWCAAVAVLVGVSALLTDTADADSRIRTAHGRIAVGAAHTCEVLDGRVRCWGSGADGRLGYGSEDNVGDGLGPSVEQAGAVPVGEPVEVVAAGEAHTCGLLLDGGVRCWGDGADGRLGYAGDTDVGDGAGPSIEEAGDVPLPGRAEDIAAGATHTCAVLETGRVNCWGAGSPPRLVDGVARAYFVAAGGDHTCAVTMSGAVPCWDVGRDPVQVALPDDDQVVDVAVGDEQACGVHVSGLVDCWSLDGQGRPGAPRAVSLAMGALAVAAGGDRACAWLEVGAVQCWEGGGSTDGTAVTSGVAALAVGPEHACVLAPDVVCWGSGADGRLGYGDTQARPAPAAAPVSATPDPTDTASPGDEMTFGGGTQAEGGGDSAPPKAGETSSGGGPSPWLALLLLPVAAVGGWLLWRRRTRSVDAGESLV